MLKDENGIRWRSLHARENWQDWIYDVSEKGIIRKWNRRVLEGSLCEPWDSTTTVQLQNRRGLKKKVNVRRIRQLCWPEIFGEDLLKRKLPTDNPETMASLRSQVAILKKQLAEVQSKLRETERLYLQAQLIIVRYTNENRADRNLDNEKIIQKTLDSPDEDAIL